MKLAISLLLALPALLLAEVKVDRLTVRDSRDTDRSHARLTLQVDVAGPEITACKGIRVEVTSAADDTGRNLQLPARALQSFANNPMGFAQLEDDQWSIDRKAKGKASLVVALASPPRAAKLAKFEGVVEVLQPAADPQSVVTVNLATETGKSLLHDALLKAQVDLLFEPPKGARLSYQLKDPGNKVAAVEYCTAQGVPLRTIRTLLYNTPVKMTVYPEPPTPPENIIFQTSLTIERSNMTTLAAAPPVGMIAKIYLKTEKSVLRLPIKFDAIKLP